jgi:hypothetical protein
MRTLIKEKWDEAVNRLSALQEQYIDNAFPGGRPSSIYRATINGASEHLIHRISVYSHGVPYISGNQRITRKHLELINAAIDNFSTSTHKIRIGYYTGPDTYGGYAISDLDHLALSKTLSFDRDSLISVCEDLRERYAPRDGYKPCSYCNKQVPEAELITGVIISQEVGGSGRCVTRREKRYCSHACNRYDQMAHEG